VGADKGINALYDAFAALGVEFGAAFRTVEAWVPRSGGVRAWLRRPAGDVASDAVHPALLDGALQACVAAAGGGLPQQLLLPLGVECLRVLRPVPERLRLEASYSRAGWQLPERAAESV
jgi:hypothetical protein